VTAAQPTLIARRQRHTGPAADFGERCGLTADDLRGMLQGPLLQKLHHHHSSPEAYHSLWSGCAELIAAPSYRFGASIG
jgi:hypothetical protein